MNYIITGACLIGALTGVRLYIVYFVWGRCKINKSLKGKTVVITGANSGIGKETALELVKRGATVIMACRDASKAKLAVDEVNKVKGEGRAIYQHIDLSSFESIKQFASEISHYNTIDVLINNAGIYKCPFQMTDDGFESQFQINHLSHALLTMLLLPKMEKSAVDSNSFSRIIMLTSTLYTRGNVLENDYKKWSLSSISQKVFSFDQASFYSNSKLNNILFSRELSLRLKQKNKPVGVYCASPGIVWTNLNRHAKISWFKMIVFSPIALLFLRTPNQGCQTVLHSVLADSLSSGSLQRNCKQMSWKGKAADDILAKKVFQMTLDTFENYLK